MSSILGPARNSVGIREVRSDGVTLDGAMILDVIGAGVAFVAASGNNAAKYVLTMTAGVTFAAVKAALALADSAIGVNGQRFTGLADPVDAQDAATKAYAQTVASTRVASVSGSAPIVSSGGLTPSISITASSGGAAGSMSAAHYTKLEGIEALADVTTFAKISTALSSASGDISVNSVNIQDVADPVDAQDAATKAWVLTQVGSSGGEWHFGVSAEPNSGSYSYFDFGGGHTTSTSATMRAVRAPRARTITEIHFQHNVGTGTAVFRHAIFINGVDSGSYLDCANTTAGADTTGSPITPVAVAAGANVSVCSKIQSGTISTPDSNPTVTLVYTEP
jgi:hypothetical protein